MEGQTDGQLSHRDTASAFHVTLRSGISSPDEFDESFLLFMPLNFGFLAKVVSWL